MLLEAILKELMLDLPLSLYLLIGGVELKGEKNILASIFSFWNDSNNISAVIDVYYKKTMFDIHAPLIVPTGSGFIFIHLILSNLSL